MPRFKEIAASDIRVGEDLLHQLIDIPQRYVSGSTSRKKRNTFTTGGIGPGITSSLFHTVYDSDYRLQSANPVFDITVGLFSGSDTVRDSAFAQDSVGKLVFPSQSVMMHQKMDVYQQFSQLLLGSADEPFFLSSSGRPDEPIGSTGSRVDEALFISFRRSFARDRIKAQTFAMRFFTTASLTDHPHSESYNLFKTSETGSEIFTDVGANATARTEFSGRVGNIIDAAASNSTVGSLFHRQGVAVLDLSRITSGSQHVSGVIDAMNSTSPGERAPIGTMVIGSSGSGNPKAKFIPDLMVSASIDDILDHICSCRFSSGSETAITFQNTTEINSTLIFCRATADEFNYSTNPTYIDDDNAIQVLEAGSESIQQSFSYVTSVGLYDAHDNLLAIAKLSRPVEKSNDKDLTFRIRLDF